MIKREKPNIKIDSDLAVAVQVIQRLNDLTGRKFKANARGNLKLINDALANGYTSDDLIMIVVYKHQQWQFTSTAAAYLRPSTLFAKHNIKRYRDQALRFFSTNQNLES